MGVAAHGRVAVKARALVPSTFVGELKTEFERIIEMEALQQALTEVKRTIESKEELEKEELEKEELKQVQRCRLVWLWQLDLLWEQSSTQRRTGRGQKCLS